VLAERGIAFRTMDSLTGDGAGFTADAGAADEGDTALLQLTSGSTAEPKAVRYGWADVVQCNLVNASGLPASPFRTDDWAN